MAMGRFKESSETRRDFTRMGKSVRASCGSADRQAGKIGSWMMHRHDERGGWRP